MSDNPTSESETLEWGIPKGDSPRSRRRWQAKKQLKRRWCFRKNLGPNAVRVCEECKADYHWRECQHTVKENIEDQWWKGTVFENNYFVRHPYHHTVVEDVFWYYVCYKCIAKERGIEDSAALRIVRGDLSQRAKERPKAWLQTDYSYLTTRARAG